MLGTGLPVVQEFDPSSLSISLTSFHVDVEIFIFGELCFVLASLKKSVTMKCACVCA
uniref:Uncharacterized protein n=1 Tax=Anguilla anguilla TaxID=7936 RepID=A0A0E9X9S1_ANGAN